MDPPIICISPSLHSLHSTSSARLHAFQYRDGLRSRSPSPSASPSPSPCPSPSTAKDTLPLPPSPERVDSCVSFASSATLNERDSPRSLDAPRESVFGGVLTAEPGEIVVSPDDHAEQPSSEPRRVFLAPTPVSYFADRRYLSRPKIPSELMLDTPIPPRNGIPRSPEIAGGKWEPFVHPEGQLYFRYKNYCTNENMYDESNRWYMDATIRLLQEEIAEKYPDMPETTEIGLRLEVDGEGDQIGCYYLCDMANEEVFWLDEVSPGFFCSLRNLHIVNRDHLSLGAQTAYWEHIYLFPHGRTIDAKMVNTVRTFAGDLGYYICDKETSRTSTAPFSSDDLYRFLQIVNDLRVNERAGEVAPVQYMTILSRLLSLVLYEKFIRYHGTIYAQLECNASVYEDVPLKHTIWFNFVSWLFGYTPRIYFDRLHKIWVDQKVNNTAWRKFINELQDDWTASITPAAVILTANVGFLAIQSVDVADRTPGQIISYISIILSIGNIFACTILARQHRPSMHYYAADAYEYLNDRTGTKEQMEKLAVVLSIPTAFFLWGLLTFFIAVLWVCFYQTNLGARIAVSFACIIAFGNLWAVLRNGDWQPLTKLQILRAKVERTRKLMKKVQTMPKNVAKKLRTMSMDAVTTLRHPRRAATMRKQARDSTLCASDTSTLRSMDSIRRCVENKV
ncbi:hypothetical protein C8Q76DRAFT_724486 [Earliella scabrosa]|nr:hypothetical protein C8Q76DRAFT_724486 [Earliella scabrosa]